MESESMVGDQVYFVPSGGRPSGDRTGRTGSRASADGEYVHGSRKPECWEGSIRGAKKGRPRPRHGARRAGVPRPGPGPGAVVETGTAGRVGKQKRTTRE